MANTWDQIVEKVEEALKKQNFTRAQDEAEEGGRSAVFTGEALAYAVTFTPSTKRIELRTCAMKEDGPDKQWKVLSSWLYDPANEEEADVESIVNDFCDTVEGPKRVAALQTAKKKRQKGEESTQDPTFMFNRFAGIYPEIRADLVDERSTYGTSRKNLPAPFTAAANFPGFLPPFFSGAAFFSAAGAAFFFSVSAIRCPSVRLTSFPCEACASGRNGNTCSFQADRGRSSCSSSCCSCAVCTPCRPKRLLLSL